jgi:hypothetical protein
MCKKEKEKAVSVNEMILCCGAADNFDIVTGIMQRAKPSII